MTWEETSNVQRSTFKLRGLPPGLPGLWLGWAAAILLGLTPLVFAQDTVAPEPVTSADKASEKVADKAIYEVETQPRESRKQRSSQKYTYRELVAVGNDATLKEGEDAREMVVVGGSAVVEGTVHSDLVVVGGRVKLGPKAVVKRDLVLVLSDFEIDPEAKIHGDRVVVGGSLGIFKKPLIQWPQQWFRKGLMWARPLPHQYPWAWAVAGAALLLYLGVAALFPRQIQATVTSLEERAGASFLAGLLGAALIPAALLILAATGVGIVAVPFVVCAAIVAFVFGNVAVYRFAGQQLGAQTGLALLQQPLAALLVGTLLFYVLYAVPILGLIVCGAVAPLGLGAVLLAAFKRAPRAGGGNDAAAPAGGIPVAGAAGQSPPMEAATGTALWPRAGFWWRVLATLLDLALVGLVAGVVFHARRFFLLFWVAYLLTLWSWKGTTVGGIICGLKIVQTDGRSIGFAAALLRLLGSFFSLAALGLGFFWAGWSRDKQSWHDKMAGTVIVRAPRGASLL